MWKPWKPMMLAVMLCGVTAVAGCNTAKPPGEAGPDVVSVSEYPKIATTSKELGDDLYLQGEPKIDRGDDTTPMRVELDVRLARDKPEFAQYRFRFYDDRGMLIRPMMEWRFQMLEARITTPIQGRATDPAAVDWQLELRPAR